MVIKLSGKNTKIFCLTHRCEISYITIIQEIKNCNLMIFDLKQKRDTASVLTINISIP